MNVHSKLFRSAPLMVNYSLLGRPLLHNHQSIVNLSDEDLDAYVMGYHLKRAGNPNCNSDPSPTTVYATTIYLCHLVCI